MGSIPISSLDGEPTRSLRQFVSLESSQIITTVVKPGKIVTIGTASCVLLVVQIGFVLRHPLSTRITAVWKTRTRVSEAAAAALITAAALYRRALAAHMLLVANALIFCTTFHCSQSNIDYFSVYQDEVSYFAFHMCIDFVISSRDFYEDAFWKAGL